MRHTKMAMAVSVFTVSTLIKNHSIIYFRYKAYLRIQFFTCLLLPPSVAFLFLKYGRYKACRTRKQ